MIKLKTGNDSQGYDSNAEEAVLRQQEVAHHFGCIFDAMNIDWRNDHNMSETPQRVARAWCEELFVGCYTAPPRLTVFNNAHNYSNLVTTGPLEVRSTCAHHLMPIVGECIISILPKNKQGKMVGLSKASRAVRWFAARFQIQEDMTNQIADYLQAELKPEGLGVMIIAEHHCVSHRGVREHNSQTMTTALRGLLLKDASLKQEFTANCNALLAQAHR